MRIELEVGDEVAAAFPFQDIVIVITRRGFIYRLRYDWADTTNCRNFWLERL